VYDLRNSGVPAPQKNPYPGVLPGMLAHQEKPTEQKKEIDGHRNRKQRPPENKNSGKIVHSRMPQHRKRCNHHNVRRKIRSEPNRQPLEGEVLCERRMPIERNRHLQHRKAQLLHSDVARWRVQATSRSRQRWPMQGVSTSVIAKHRIQMKGNRNESNTERKGTYHSCRHRQRNPQQEFRENAGRCKLQRLPGR